MLVHCSSYSCWVTEALQEEEQLEEEEEEEGIIMQLGDQSQEARASLMQHQEEGRAILGEESNKTLAVKATKKYMFRHLKFRINKGSRVANRKLRDGILKRCGFKLATLDGKKAEDVWEQVKRDVEEAIRTRRNSVRDAVKLKMRGKQNWRRGNAALSFSLHLLIVNFCLSVLCWLAMFKGPKPKGKDEEWVGPGKMPYGKEQIQSAFLVREGGDSCWEEREEDAKEIVMWLAVNFIGCVVSETSFKSQTKAKTNIWTWTTVSDFAFALMILDLYHGDVRAEW